MEHYTSHLSSSTVLWQCRASFEVHQINDSDLMERENFFFRLPQY